MTEDVSKPESKEPDNIEKISDLIPFSKAFVLTYIFSWIAVYISFETTFPSDALPSNIIIWASSPFLFLAWFKYDFIAKLTRISITLVLIATVMACLQFKVENVYSIKRDGGNTEEFSMTFSEVGSASLLEVVTGTSPEDKIAQLSTGFRSQANTVRTNRKTGFNILFGVDLTVIWLLILRHLMRKESTASLEMNRKFDGLKKLLAKMYP